MTDLYPHFSYLLDKNLQQREEYLAQQIDSEDDRAALRRLLENCEPQIGDTQWVGEYAKSLNNFSEFSFDDLLGVSIGPYRLVQPIGQGGMGVVYLAQRIDGRYEQQVAFKFIFPSFAKVAGDSLQNEARLLARIKHPAITQVLDAGCTPEGLHFIMMEYVDGQPLDRYLKTHPLDFSSKLKLFIQITDAIAAAHRLNIVHGDLKPANILVTRDGRIKLLDFGIAKQVLHEQSATARLYLQAMSLNYAAPEQLATVPVSAATDQYALGCLLYLCLTGREPYSGETRTFIEILAQKTKPVEPAWPFVTSLFDRLRVKYLLDPVLQKTLEIEPNQRFNSVTELQLQIEHVLQHRPLFHQWQWYWRWGYTLRRSPRLTLFLTFLALSTTALFIQNQQIRLQRNNAEQMSMHLTKLWQSTDPASRNLPEIRAVELLQQGEKTITSDVNLSIEMRWRLLQTIAEGYFNIGDYNAAGRLIFSILDEQIVSEKLQVETVMFYCATYEYLQLYLPPNNKALTAVSQYFAQLSTAELLNEQNALALLSLLAALGGESSRIPDFAKLEPYLAQMVANYPDNKWKSALLYRTETLWDTDMQLLNSGKMTKQQWLASKEKQLNELLIGLQTTDVLHPNYVDLIVVSLNLARIVDLQVRNPEKPRELYQQLENALAKQQLRLGKTHEGVLRAMDAAILAAEYLDDWSLMASNIERLERELTSQSSADKWRSIILRQKAALYLRQGRKDDLTMLAQQLTEQLTRQPDNLNHYSFYHLLTLADALTAVEEKKAYSKLHSWLELKRLAMHFDSSSDEFYRQQFAMRQSWAEGKNSEEPTKAVDRNFVSPESLSGLSLEWALLFNKDDYARTALKKALSDTEFEAKMCPPTYCFNTVKLTVLPLKLAKIELQNNQMDTARFWLDFVESSAQKSNNSRTNIWLQQTKDLRTHYFIQ